MSKRILVSLFLILLFSCDTNEEGIIKGKVIKVADGDTVTILTGENEKIRIRLEGIDAPEKGQDFSRKSKDYLNNLCYGKNVKVVDKGKDRYGRTLGILYVDGINVNEEMVRNGLAWYYRYFVDDTRLDSLEKIARKEKLNIWSKKNPVSPYEYRKSNKKKR